MSDNDTEPTVHPDQIGPRRKSVGFASDTSTSTSALLRTSHPDFHSHDSPIASPAERARLLRELSFEPSKLHILLVEDDKLSAASIMRALKQAGYEKVTHAVDGKEALDLLQENPKAFDLVCSDVHMPRLDGEQLLKEVSLIPELRGIPFIMLSASHDVDIVYRCLQMGAEDYLLKPIRVETVRHMWQTLWRKRKERAFLDEIMTARSSSENLTKTVDELKHKLQGLQARMDEAVQTPIQAIMRTVMDLMAESSVNDHVRVALSNILHSLAASDMYRVVLSNVANGDGKIELEDTTVKWLQSELKFVTDRRSSATEVVSWPNTSDNVELKRLTTWNFDVWKHSEAELLTLLEGMFYDFGLVETFSIDPEALRNFLLDVHRNYQPNTYHNFRHAFDVTQVVYLFLREHNAVKWFSRIDIFALLVSAICHDLDHPGLNNAYHIATESTLALRYNDQSVLENYHAHNTFVLLRKSENNILTGINTKQYKLFRAAVINNIIATDLSHHMEIVSKFTNAQDKIKEKPQEFRGLLAQVIIKCADISNPLRPFRLAKYWAEMIQEEFVQQGDLERAKGLPISPFMDRHNKDLPLMQLNFIKFLVSPLFRTMSQLTPGLSGALATLEDNRATWLKIQEADRSHDEIALAAALAEADARTSDSEGSPPSSSVSTDWATANTPADPGGEE